MIQDLARRRFLAALAGGALYAQAPGRVLEKRDMIARSTRPEDLEMPLAGFADEITPLEHFFVRTHVYTPAVNVGAWRLQVDGSVAQPLTLSLDELRRMPSTEVVSVLECAGNGRAFYDPPVAGLQWRNGAVGNGRWRGVRLADVLKRAGVKSGAVEVLFDGADVPLGRMADFRRSIPLRKAVHPDTLLAYEMNGVELPQQHGFPLRAIVPGWAGDSWAKWLTGIHVLQAEDDGYWMKSAYRHPGRPVAPGTVVPAANMSSVTSLRVKSVIASPLQGSSVEVGKPLLIRGVAWSGDAGPIQRVEVSVDTGRRWAVARFVDKPTRWGWRRWEFEWTPTAERFHSIFVRSRDAGGEMQPAAQEWNPSGYLWNVIPRVDVNVVRSVSSSATPPKSEEKSLPPAPPRFQETCMLCHQDDVIRQQRLTRAQWDREITKMTDWGAPVAAGDRETLLDFLARSFGN
ncbi:MAG: sulfite oxidase [Acidobacteriota bacterium]